MKKKSNEGNGVLFPPELREVTGRLKDKEPELDALVTRESQRETGETRVDTKKKARDRLVITAVLRKEIVEIVRAEIAAMSDIQIGQNIQTIEVPPRPAEKVPSKKSSRKVSPEKREKIATNCDAELLRLFTEWRTKRGLALNRALDAALWHFLSKPKLSFEKKGN